MTHELIKKHQRSFVSKLTELSFVVLVMTGIVAFVRHSRLASLHRSTVSSSKSTSQIRDSMREFAKSRDFRVKSDVGRQRANRVCVDCLADTTG